MPKPERPYKNSRFEEGSVTTDFALDMSFHVALNAVRSIKNGRPIEEVEAGLVDLLSKSPRMIPKSPLKPTSQETGK